MTTPPPPGQPGNPFGQQPPGGQPDFTGQPTGGQPPTYGQPPVGQPPVGGYAPVPGTPPYTPPPAPPAPSPLKRILRIVIPIIVVIVIAVIVSAIFRDKDSGESINATQVGSCITVAEASGLNVETKAISCDDSTTPNFIVGAKLASSDECEKAGYSGYVYEAGRGAADEVLCLTPNYQVGECYEENQIGSISLKLEPVSCSETSTSFSTAFKITDRADSDSLPGCTGPTNKVLTTEIQSEPARSVSFCAEILGEGYVWK